MSTDLLAEAKRQLPLPALMEKLGFGDRVKKSARCPFHEDGAASFSVYDDAGEFRWKCFAGCGGGDAVDFLGKSRGLNNGDACREYLKLAGIVECQASKPRLDWPSCVAAFGDRHAKALAEWRGLLSKFVYWLHAQGIVGLHGGKLALAVHDGEKVAACHKLVDREANRWAYEPKGVGTRALIFGNLGTAKDVYAFESQWDGFATMEKLDWHVSGGLPDAAVITTRGASNARLVAGKLRPDATVFAFAQNDAPGQKWAEDLADAAGCQVRRVVTPAPHKDLNDWTRAGATRQDIESAMAVAETVKPQVGKDELQSSTNVRRENFAEITAELHAGMVRILASKLLPTQKERQIISLVVDSLLQSGSFYFHRERRDFDSVMFFNRFQKRLLRVRSDEFLGGLSRWILVNRADRLFKFVLAAVETEALAGKNTTGILPEFFWACRPGAIYISNGDGQAVKITVSRIEAVDNGTDGILFPAGKTLAPWKLSEPRDVFQTCRLFREAHASAPHGKLLLQIWLYSLPTNPASKPPVCLPGPVGSGKTRTAKGIVEFLGLPFVAHKVEENSENDFWPSCDFGGIFILDNADTRCRWLPDAVANAATDGCSQRRKLYTNSETVTLRARAWLIITTANPTFASDSGLADRLLVVRMDRQPGAETSDAELGNEILSNRDAGMSHLAQTLQVALADKLSVPAALNKRHPDFAAFAVRLGRALGREAEAVAALKAAENDKAAFCLENDPIASALLLYLQAAGSFIGTAAELVPFLVEVDGELRDRLTPKRLGKRLSALWPHVESALATARREIGRTGTTVFNLKWSTAGYAGFQGVISQNPSRETSQGGFTETSPPNPANPATLDEIEVT